MNTELETWFKQTEEKLRLKYAPEAEVIKRVPILVQEAWYHQQAKLDVCIQALQSIGVIVDDTEDERDNLEALKERWLKREKELLINTMLEDTQICRDALRKIGALK